MLVGNLPGRGDTEDDRLNHLQKFGVNFPAGCKISHITKEFIIDCLAFEEKDRLTWQNVY